MKRDLFSRSPDSNGNTATMEYFKLYNKTDRLNMFDCTCRLLFYYALFWLFTWIDHLQPQMILSVIPVISWLSTNFKFPIWFPINRDFHSRKTSTSIVSKSQDVNGFNSGLDYTSLSRVYQLDLDGKVFPRSGCCGGNGRGHEWTARRMRSVGAGAGRSPRNQFQRTARVNARTGSLLV